MSHKSSLCRRCRFLKLDDMSLGGSTAITEDGEDRLELPFGDPYREGVWNIQLDYHLTDDYPELPKLAASARTTGCEFCLLLRYGIQQFATFQGKPSIDITMGYRWSRRDGHGGKGPLGLTGLIVQLLVSNPGSEAINSPTLPPPHVNAVEQNIMFVVDGSSGELQPQL
jgi:hypothetical protein